MRRLSRASTRQSARPKACAVVGAAPGGTWIENGIRSTEPAVNSRLPERSTSAGWNSASRTGANGTRRTRSIFSGAAGRRTQHARPSSAEVDDFVVQRQLARVRAGRLRHDPRLVAEHERLREVLQCALLPEAREAERETVRRERGRAVHELEVEVR